LTDDEFSQHIFIKDNNPLKSDSDWNSQFYVLPNDCCKWQCAW